ncbi:MAG TPA: hypothetical protein VLA14_05075 [Polyangia bacterium]|jgi:hypothetical protein|nr:hypothetical protein [Polyangia bacterium]
MNKLKLSFGVLLLGSVALAANFAACSKSNSTGGTAGASGTAGAGTAGAGTAGAAGGESATMANGKCVPGAFARGTPPVCACQSDTPTVCEEACTDTTTDDANCGACATACGATSTCNASKCGPAAKVVLPAISGCSAMSIAISGSTIYYTDGTHGTVASVPTAGGTSTPIVSGETSPGMLAITGQTLLWVSTTAVMSTGDGGVPITTTTAHLRKATLPTGPATDLAIETNTNGGIMGFTLSPDASTVYYSSGTDVKSIALSATSATPPTIVAIEQLGGVPTALGISADGKTLAYVTMINGDVDVVTLGTSAASTNGNMCPANTACCGMHDPTDPAGEALLNTNCTRVGRSQGNPFYGAVILKNGIAYWINDGSLDANAATPGAAQGNYQVGTTNGGTVTALAGTATNIYIGNSTAEAIQKAIYSAPPDGGMNPDPTSLVRAQSAPSSIAFDTTNVYWSTTVQPAAAMGTTPAVVGACTIASTAQ